VRARSDVSVLEPVCGQPWAPAAIAAYFLGINRRERERALAQARTSSGPARQMYVDAARARQRLVLEDLQLLRQVSMELRQ